ncbi:MAG TPA: response regulator [Polyangiaceae bacterium]|jgi:two-component system chemotaxis sensor kinase CheA
MAKDPYKYFRIEARELLDGLGAGVLELERGSGGAELVVRMLRLAHTLKGAARVVGQAGIADAAHAVEDVLAPHRTADGGALPAEALRRLLQSIDDMGARVAALGVDGAAPSPGRGAPGPAPLENVRIQIGEMDALLEGVFETDVRLTAIRRDLEDVARAATLAASLVKSLPAATRARGIAEELASVISRADRTLTAGLDQVDHEIAQVREKAHELRLVPASAVFAELERVARDAAQSLGRSVRLETSGGDHRLEANVLFAIRDALQHVVRNAVAHGIEPPEERRRAGKPPEGLVRLEVMRRGHRIAFVCRDDGRGIDVDAVRRVVVLRGVATAERVAALSAEELVAVVLESGLSTSDQITQVSGRGIGLDVLRATAADLKGEISLKSEAGRGTTVDVCVPVSLSSVSALVLDAGGLLYSLPLDAVRQTLRLRSGDIARSSERDSIVVEGEAVPFMPLASLFGGAASATLGRAWSAVVVQAGPQRAAIGVDRLVGTSSVVLRPLPRLAGSVPAAAGASLDAEGNPRLVLDPRGLVEAARASRGSAALEAPAAARAPVLIIDDSLTTRMLEQSILESAGYTVDLAESAEEGLAKARRASYGLFLVDVEMPGMDGFTFVAQTRADPALRAVPAILVTSRHSTEDRRRGVEAGAHAYVVKGEFDQGHLLRTIRLLIG